MPSWVSKPPKRAHLQRRRAAVPSASSAAGGSALCFLLCSIQMTVGGQFYSNEKQFPFLLFNLQSNVVTSISLLLLIQI
jgi:hypothetical protein